MRDICCVLIAGPGVAGGDRRATGESQVSTDLGQETSRRAKAGPLIRRAVRGCSYMPPKDSGCFDPVVTTTGGSTTRRVSQLANRRCAALRGPRLASARVSRAWCRGWLCPRLSEY